MIQITVYGMPAPQGSKRGFVNKYTGKVSMVESSKAVKPWREAVKCAALDARRDGQWPLNGPLRVTMVFTMSKPKSAPKTRVTFPDRKPDLSKLIRSTEDALVDAGVIVDDARIIVLVAGKVYPGEAPQALDSPGCVITISEISS